jgi:hypothetical protein
MTFPIRVGAVVTIAAICSLASFDAARANVGDFEDALIEARCVALHASRIATAPGNTVYLVTCRGRSPSTITVTCVRGDCTAEPSPADGRYAAEGRLHPRD